MFTATLALRQQLGKQGIWNVSSLLSLKLSRVSQERNGWFETQMDEDRGAGDWRDGEALLLNPTQQEIGLIFSPKIAKGQT